MIIGYYHQIFFGGGTYYKLSKKNDEKQYKFENCHQNIPNYIPKAQEYIKKYDTLKIENERFKEQFEGKIVDIYLDCTSEINTIMEIINNTDWDIIVSQEYTSDNLDDVSWYFYIENDLNTNYLAKGYSVYPKEIESIYMLFSKMKEKYIENKG